jgi:hypothetical protein
MRGSAEALLRQMEFFRIDIQADPQQVLATGNKGDAARWMRPHEVPALSSPELDEAA